MKENENAAIIVQAALDLHNELGLLINFGGEMLKGNIERLVNNLEESP